jgi:hypothetical protein
MMSSKLPSDEMAQAIEEEEQEALTKYDTLLQEIKAELPNKEKTSTEALAAFYVVSYVYQWREIADKYREKTRESGYGETWLEDEKELQYLKNRTPEANHAIEALLDKQICEIMNGMTTATVTEITKSKTSSFADFERNLNLLKNPEFQYIQKQYEAASTEEKANVVPNESVPPALVWKLTNLQQEVMAARDNSNLPELKARILELGTVCEALMEDESWLKQMRNLQALGKATTATEDIRITDLLIHGHHKNGPMLQRSAANPQNALALLNCKEENKDWVIYEAVPILDVVKLKPFLSGVPTEVFERPKFQSSGKI